MTVQYLKTENKEENSVVNYFYQDGVALYTTDKYGKKQSKAL